MGRANSGVRVCPWFALAGGAIVALLLLPAPLPREASRSGPIGTAVEPEPELIVDPSTWRLAAGNSTSLSAAWVGLPPRCSLAPLWFRWGLVGATAEGVLGTTTSENATFFGTSAETGTTAIAVRSASGMTCGATARVLLGFAEANVTVVAPVRVTNLVASPNPLRENGTANVTGEIDGGLPPYLVSVAWGDGRSTNLTVERPGSFVTSHRFASGSYRPLVVVVDAAGQSTRGTVDADLTVSDGLAAGLAAPATSVDVGTSLEFRATTLDLPNGSSWGWSCTNPARPEDFGNASITNLSCAFSDVGVGSVLFEVFPPVPGVGVTAGFSEDVEPLPTLTPVGGNVTAEVGLPSAVPFEIAGGVPPFQLTWSEIGTSEQGTETAAADGRVFLPIVPSVAGDLSLAARLTDSDGVAATNATTPLVVDPALVVTAISARTPTSDGAALQVTGSVLAGTPPFDWAVVPSCAATNGSPAAGNLSTVGAFGWSANYSVEGSVNLTVVVADAAGGVATALAALVVVPPLAVQVSVDPSGLPPAGDFALGLRVAGGVPPFQVNVSATAGLEWNRTISSDGAFIEAFTTGIGGLLDLRITVVDALGVVANSTARAPVVPPPAPTPPNASRAGAGASEAEPLLVTGLVVAVGVAMGAFSLWRRHLRSRSPPPPPVDAREVLRGIIEPAEGADRATVELLADEAGVPIELAAATIDRLKADGTLRSEIDSEGGEILAWSSER